jgi:hypothetical protein
VPSDPIRVLLHVTELLERIGTSYLLGGSLASSMFGEPRSTVDIDIAIVLRSADVPGLVAGLGSEFYVDEGAMRHAVERHTSFTAIHPSRKERISPCTTRPDSRRSPLN